MRSSRAAIAAWDAECQSYNADATDDGPHGADATNTDIDIEIAPAVSLPAGAWAHADEGLGEMEGMPAHEYENTGDTDREPF